MPKLTLDLPEAVYDQLHADAERHGRTVEEEARDLVLDHFPAASEPAGTREEALRRIRERWKEIPSITVSPEEMKEWINTGRP